MSLVPVSSSNTLATNNALAVANVNDPNTIIGTRAMQAAIRPYVIANLDPYAIDRAARLHRSAAGNMIKMILICNLIWLPWILVHNTVMTANTGINLPA